MGAKNLTAATTATREVKTAKIRVVSGLFGLFVGLSAFSSTGASNLVSVAHDLYYHNHFLPLLTTSYA
jgi:hypothetical protein